MPSGTGFVTDVPPAAGTRILSRDFDEVDLDVICTFLRRSRESNERHAEWLRERARQGQPD